MKFLIVLVILLAVVVWLQRAVRRVLGNVVMGAAGNGAMGSAQLNEHIRAQMNAQAGTRAGGQMPPGMAARQEAVVEQMVQCAACGIHVPDSEALKDSAGRYFCSAEHKAQAGAH